MAIRLALDDFRRYGRQMILQNFGLPAQQKLREASVCIVGIGGLGCPAAQYLAAAGVGRVGLVDNDTVDLSNLQRQILHSESKIGMYKAESAARFIRELNSTILVDIHVDRLLPSNVRNLLQPYDVVMDCTDNTPTRYLLSDTCVALGKPLVSGAALQFDGQLCVYNFMGSPCYRCLFPKPPLPETLGSCEENGVLGTVTGVIGVLQALEAIKIITGLADGTPPSLLIYSALTMPPFRSVRLRTKKKDCPACSEDGKQAQLIDRSDYLEFCGASAPDFEALGLQAGEPGSRISAKGLESLLKEKACRIVDVRPKVEFGICQLPDSINIPLSELIANPWLHSSNNSMETTVFVCRLGNDSQIAASALRGEPTNAGEVYDLLGGLRRWSKEVDPNFPIY